MYKSLLLFVGLSLLVIQHYFKIFPGQLQFILFVAGIILLGVPHGAADLLVATQNKFYRRKSFSVSKFFISYLGRLALSAIILYFFPLTGIAVFILLASYHFGQTDLEKLPSDRYSKHLFTIAYGLLILSTILLQHFDEVKPLYHLFYSVDKIPFILNFIDFNRSALQIVILVFCISTVLFYIINNIAQLKQIFPVVMQLIVLVIIIYSLPMLLGFTFYFIMWHSLSSLTNIVAYLSSSGTYTISEITKQIIIYSLLAMGGIVIGGFAGYLLIDDKSIIIYTLLGLAVLTTPHMQVMNEMYIALSEPRLAGGR